MTTIRRSFGVLLLSLALGALAACGGGGPAAKIGELSIARYVALGDGYASAPYSGPTENAKGCLRSASSYPALLAQELDAEEFVDATCAFARTRDLTRSSKPSRGDGETVAAQIDELTEDTDLVTLTIGISDRSFGRRAFEACVAPCGDGGVLVTELATDLQRLTTSVEEALGRIVAKAPKARVVLVGYPTLLPREGDCPAMPEMSQQRADLTNAVLAELNKALRKAARASRVDYLDTAELSTGHDMCADEPWVKGEAAGEEEVPRFHPFALFNEAVADRLAVDLEP